MLQYLLKLSIISFVIFAICQKKTKKTKQKKKRSITSNDIRKFLTLYSRKLSREKTFVILQFCGYKRNLGHGVLQHSKSEQSAKVFSAKIVFSPICAGFLPRKFPTIRYQQHAMMPGAVYGQLEASSI